MNITTATPTDIDTQIAAHQLALDSAATAIDRHFRRCAATKTPAPIPADLITRRDQALAALALLTAEYHRRGGWTRAFLVNNAGGHVHSSTSCQTCRHSTSFRWITTLSGHTEDEIIAAAGELACTRCYPNAPVEITSRPGTIRTDHQLAAEQRAAEKAERAAAAAAKAIANPDGTPLRSSYGVVKTERAAEIEAVRGLADAIFYIHDGETHPSAPEWEDFAHRTAAAVAHKHGTDAAAVLAGFRTKAEKKAARDLKEAQKHAQKLRLV